MNSDSNIRVLVVDASQAVCENLRTFLEDYGFETATCTSTEEARDLMREAPFDVCVVDVCLPGLSGEDLIKLASKHFPRQRYIIHTESISYTLPDDLQALGMSPDYVFQKPMRAPNLLVKRIKELVDARDAPHSPPHSH